jgi:hypothetical protein
MIEKEKDQKFLFTDENRPRKAYLLYFRVGYSYPLTVVSGQGMWIVVITDCSKA